MVLHDVPQRARCFVEIATLLDAHRLRYRYLNVVDVIARPQRLEYGVGKTKRQDVLHCLFTEVMVDPVNLVLFENLVQSLVQLPGGRPGAPEWFLDNEAGRTARLGLVEAHLAERPGYLAKDIWHGRQVVRPVAAGTESLVDFLQPGVERAKVSGSL